MKINSVRCVPYKTKRRGIYAKTSKKLVDVYSIIIIAHVVFTGRDKIRVPTCLYLINYLTINFINFLA